MKYLIASDIHGSVYYASKLIGAFKKESADRLILLGDLYYHGPRNPLPNEYNPMAVAELLNSFKDQIIAVQGNCDSEVDQMISQFKFLPHYELNLPPKFFFTHGHKYNSFDPPPLDFDIMIYGHEHAGYIKQPDKKSPIFANCGSVSMPKNNTPHSYIVLDKDALMLKNLLSGEIIDEISLTGI